MSKLEIINSIDVLLKVLHSKIDMTKHQKDVIENKIYNLIDQL